MLQITITEFELEEDIEQTVEAIVLIERAEEVLEKIINLEDFDNVKNVNMQLAEISKLLFTARKSLDDSLTFFELE